MSVFFFNLKEVQGKTIEYADGVGNFIARLMRVVGPMSLSPTSLTTSSMSVSEQEDISFMQKQISCTSSDEITLPTITDIDSLSLLLIQRDNDAHKMDIDEYFILDDPNAHGNYKMKKDFCEPVNVTFNPPITLLATFSSTKDNIIALSRSDTVHGNVACT